MSKNVFSCYFIWYSVKARLIYTGDFCRGNSMQFLSRLSCNFKIARANQVRYSVRFVVAISQGFRTCLKLDAIFCCDKNCIELPRQKSPV